MTVWAVVVAAGSGSRFGGPKQFTKVAGRPLVDWSVAAARTVADGVVLVVPVERVTGHGTHGADLLVAGGPTRTASVRAGLDVVPLDAAVIVVHDGARPLASPALFRSVVEAVVAGAAAAIPGIALVDTVKRIDGEDAAGAEATDDAALVEALGATVRVVTGDRRNMKVTTPADLETARTLLEA
jgi:2-C-methyl-D-erythritol 4-phosphate cytidylyltransferase